MENIKLSIEGYDGWTQVSHYFEAENQFGVGVVGKNPLGTYSGYAIPVQATNHEQAILKATPALMAWLDERLTVWGEA